MDYIPVILDRVNKVEHVEKDMLLKSIAQTSDVYNKLLKIVIAIRINYNNRLLAIPLAKINDIKKYNKLFSNLFYSEDGKYYLKSDYSEYLKSPEFKQLTSQFECKSINKIISDFDVCNFNYKKVLNDYNEYIKDACNYKFNVPHKYPQDTCPICCVSKFKYVWLPCGHNVCKPCFTEMVKHCNRKCPFCNGRF